MVLLCDSVTHKNAIKNLLIQKVCFIVWKNHRKLDKLSFMDKDFVKIQAEKVQKQQQAFFLGQPQIFCEVDPSHKLLQNIDTNLPFLESYLKAKFPEPQALNIQKSTEKIEDVTMNAQKNEQQNSALQYEKQLNDKQTLNIIATMIEQMTTPKSNKQKPKEKPPVVVLEKESPDTRSAIDEIHDVGPQNGTTSQENFELQKAKVAILLANVLKEELPQYSLENIICAMHENYKKMPKKSTKNPIKPTMKSTPSVTPVAPVLPTKNGPISKRKAPFAPSQPPKPQKKKATKPIEQQYLEDSDFQYSPELQQQQPKKNGSKSRNKKASNQKKVIQDQSSVARQMMQKDVAYVFVTEGYGLPKAKQHLKHIDGNKYNSLLTSVVRAAMRKLCDILTRNMGQNIKVFGFQEQKLLRSPMVNCRKWLNQSQQQTFFKLINIVYGMNQDKLFQDQVLALYDKMTKQLDKRTEYERERAIKKKQDMNTNTERAKASKGEKSVFQKVVDPSKLKSTNAINVIPARYNQATFSPPPIATSRVTAQSIATSPSTSQIVPPKSNMSPALEKQIADLYVTFRSQDNVHLLLTKRHPQVQWDRQAIRATLYKLIKIGLKKMLKAKRDHEAANHRNRLPGVTLTETLVNRILEHPLALGLRISAVQGLMQRQLSLERTAELIGMTNSVLAKITQNG